MPRFRNPKRNKRSYRQRCLKNISGFIDLQIRTASLSRRALIRTAPILAKALELQQYYRETRYLVKLKRDRIRSSELLEKVLSGEDEEHFFDTFRMSPRQFDLLVSLIKDHPVFSRRGKKPQRSVETQLKIALHRFAHDGSLSSNKALGRNLGVSVGSVSRYTRRCANALCSLMTTYIRWPTNQEKVKTKRTFASKNFPDLIGAVDGVMIPIHTAPSDERDAFATRKNNFAVGATGVADGRGYFTFFSTGYVGTKHDSAAYKDTALYQQKKKYFQDQDHLVGDQAYALSPTVITAFPGKQLPVDRDSFNVALRSCRVKIEHAFGLLKGRFPSLRGIRCKYLAERDLEEINKHIYACVVMHNFLICHPDSSFGSGFESESDEENGDDEGYEDVGQGDGQGDGQEDEQNDGQEDDMPWRVDFTSRETNQYERLQRERGEVKRLALKNSIEVHLYGN